MTNSLKGKQLTFNNIIFNPNNKMDQKVLALLKHLGVESGKNFDPQLVAKINGEKFAKIAAKISR
ncbi:MAG: hypothetical protein GQ581_01320 [Methyloprofundus sp.]|nr:hypothetical protein [Methyloprofundus sp.]